MRNVVCIAIVMFGFLSESPAQSSFGRSRFGAPRFYATTTPVYRTIPREIREDYKSEEVAILQKGTEPTVQGDRAALIGGIAYAPSEAPLAIKRAIWAANTIQRKPYRWGGGHASFYDRGYDCSGTVSFALHHAGLLRSPLSSRGLMNWGKKGRGKWMTVYSRKGHSFAVIAGLRLDTTGRSEREGPRWHRSGRSTAGFQPRTVAGL